MLLADWDWADEPTVPTEDRVGVTMVVSSIIVLRPRALPLTANALRWLSVRRIRFRPIFSIQRLNLGVLERDDFPLLTVHPAGQDEEEELPGA